MSVSNFMRTHKRRIGAKPVDAPPDDFCEDRPYNEWQVPVAPPGPHFLDLISQQGTFKSAPSPTVTDLCAQKPVADPPPPPVKTRLYTCVNAYEMRSIDPAVGTFKCSLRLYLLWRVDFTDPEYLPFREFLEKAKCNGSHYSLSNKEVAEFSERVRIPKVFIANSADQKTLDEPSIRVYGGQTPACMFNQAFEAEYKQVFALHSFPFDVQKLSIELQQNDSRVWDMYDLSVCTVQFKRSMLELQEWFMLEPEVRRGSPAHKNSIITFNIRRKSAYYIANIVRVVQMLAGLGLLVFAFDVRACGLRTCSGENTML